MLCVWLTFGIKNVSSRFSWVSTIARYRTTTRWKLRSMASPSTRRTIREGENDPGLLYRLSNRSHDSRCCFSTKLHVWERLGHTPPGRAGKLDGQDPGYIIRSWGNHFWRWIFWLNITHPTSSTHPPVLRFCILKHAENLATWSSQLINFLYELRRSSFNAGPFVDIGNVRWRNNTA